MIRDGGVRWRPSQQQSGRLLVLTVAVMVSAAAVQYWTTPPWWVLIVLAGVVGVGAPALWWLRRRAVRADLHAQAIESNVRSIQGTDLQRVSGVTLAEFGVHRSHVHVPYMERDIHGEVLGFLRSAEPLLVLGHSLAGKSRLGAELLRRHYGHRLLVVPTPPQGLAQLFSSGAIPENAVIWLDDLDRYIGTDQLRVEWLDRAVRAGNLVVATMRASAYENFQPTGTMRPPQWELLERFQTVWLHQDADERRRLAARVTDAKLRAGIARYGLAEYVGGGAMAVERFNTGEAQHPLGAALVRAAADWRRTGLEIVPESVLLGLAPSYLPMLTQLAADEAAEALAWAGETIDETVSLLEPTPTGWRAFDYIVDHVAEQGRPVPDAVWDAAVAAAGDRLVAVGYTAAVVHHRLEVAERAWFRAADERGDEVAMFNLGLLLEQRGRHRDAEHWYRRAALDQDVAATMVDLGVILEQEGDHDRARQWWRRAGKEQGLAATLLEFRRRLADAGEVPIGSVGREAERVAVGRARRRSARRLRSRGPRRSRGMR